LVFIHCRHARHTTQFTALSPRCSTIEAQKEQGIFLRYQGIETPCYGFEQRTFVNFYLTSSLSLKTPRISSAVTGLQRDLPPAVLHGVLRSAMQCWCQRRARAASRLRNFRMGGHPSTMLIHPPGRGSASVISKLLEGFGNHVSKTRTTGARHSPGRRTWKRSPDWNCFYQCRLHQQPLG
jgi:hypothetical protein